MPQLLQKYVGGGGRGGELIHVESYSSTACIYSTEIPREKAFPGNVCESSTGCQSPKKVFICANLELVCADKLSSIYRVFLQLSQNESGPACG